MARLNLLFLVFVVVGCSSSGRVSAPVDVPDDSTAVDSVATETFDIAPYADQPVDIHVDLEHDVPASLMENRADAGIEIRVSGFRVQVYSTLDQEEAASAEEAVRAFWKETIASSDPGAGLPPDLPIYGLFRQPYYRIRAGDFVERAEADRIAVILGRRFEGVLVVPDQVTVVK